MLLRFHLFQFIYPLKRHIHAYTYSPSHLRPLSGWTCSRHIKFIVSIVFFGKNKMLNWFVLYFFLSYFLLSYILRLGDAVAIVCYHSKYISKIFRIPDYILTMSYGIIIHPYFMCKTVRLPEISLDGKHKVNNGKIVINNNNSHENIFQPSMSCTDIFLTCLNL